MGHDQDLILQCMPSVIDKSPYGQVDSLLGSRLLRPRQKSAIVDTDFPLHEATLFKEEEEGGRVNTFHRCLSLLDLG
jgi:hypothetical protein